MRAPTLSIIIPVYNAASVVHKIVGSIVDQPFTDWELLLINDKSTDDSAAAIRELAHYDSRIHVFNRTTNGGASAARNDGIRKARGKYLMFFDADDDIKPAMVKELMSAALPQKLPLVCCGNIYNTYDNKRLLSSIEISTSPLPGRLHTEDWPTYIAKLLGMDGRLYQVWNKLYRADIIREHQLFFDEGVNFGEDLMFNLRYFSRINQIKFINQPLYIYNLDISGGTYSKSSLVWHNREINYQALVEFTKDSHDTKLPDYLAWIRHNWFYAYALAVQRSPLPTAKKRQLLKTAIQSNFLGTAAKRSIVGTKKYLVQTVIRLFSHSSYLLNWSLALAGWLRDSKLTSGLWRKLKSGL